MSQSALARALGYSVAGVSRRMTGATEWGFSEMREVARVLDTSVAFIAGETDVIARPDHLRTNDESPAAFATGDSDTVCAPRDSNPRPSDP
ncbi:helix-turn-helix domain-containing protein [Leucobacter luti]|uniref:helix-turn-helix domain-containing protein n=1 Tax=Leucobacter luti TaxID=340320 RepID=UPI00105209C3